MESIGKLNTAVYRNIQSIINQRMDDLPFGSGQQDFFLVISKNEGISQKELSDCLYIGKSTTAKAVKKLIDIGYIKKEKDKKDKRIDRLYLTEEGKSIVPRVQNLFVEIIEITNKNLTEQESEQAIILLKKILSNVTECKELNLK